MTQDITYTPVKFGAVHGIAEMSVLLRASELVGFGVSKLLISVHNVIQPEKYK